tara:strand:- start:1088 stop:1348 length:261 start_codon:yes stop_codon:yes gene_type:complete
MKFRLYTKANCPYCHMAVSLLTENQKEFECYALDKRPELLNEIQSTYRWNTVPVIVEITEGQEKFIGGFTDLQRYLADDNKQILRG